VTHFPSMTAVIIVMSLASVIPAHVATEGRNIKFPRQRNY